MAEVRVVRDLLNEEQLDKLNDLLLGRHFPFYWHDDIDVEGRTEDPRNFGFSHELYNHTKNFVSGYIPNFEDIVTAALEKIGLEFKSLLRMRVVMLTNVGREHMNDAHVDLDLDDYCTLVFYPHDTDGDFYWYENGQQNRVPVSKNTCIFMRGKIPHHGSSPVNSRRRIVVNVNLVAE